MNQEYKDNLDKITLESDKAFDHKIFYLSSGGLALLFSMCTINNTLNINWQFILAAVAFIIALVFNMCSHLYVIRGVKKISKKLSKTSIFDVKRKDMTVENIVSDLNKTTTRINYVNVLLFVFATILSMCFLLNK